MRFEHLYIHVPFCARRCVYCDFSIAVRSTVPAREFVQAVDSEWATRHRESAFALRTLYFGGGTPSKLGGDGVARLMDVVRARSTFTADAEVTLEANPEDVSPSFVRACLAAGVNRLSLGVQSFDDEVLTWMHRTHDAAGAHRAIDVARDAGLDNVSIDLIFATPANLERDWARDLELAASLDLPHVSVYGLTVEPRTPLGRWVARQEVAETAEESFADQFLAAHHRLTSAGYEHYEVSNYGRPGRHSRHNWAYWNRAPYAGLGPSAHEFDGLCRRWNAEAYAAWAETTVEGNDPLEGSERLDDGQRGAEDVYLGLRTNRGLKIGSREAARAASWVSAEWCRIEGDVLTLTAAGWLRLDTIAADLTHVRSRY